MWVCFCLALGFGASSTDGSGWRLRDAAFFLLEGILITDRRLFLVVGGLRVKRRSVVSPWFDKENNYHRSCRFCYKKNFLFC